PMVGVRNNHDTYGRQVAVLASLPSYLCQRMEEAYGLHCPRAGGFSMTFEALLAQVLDLLQRQRRVSYWALKRQFELHHDDLEGLKIELIEAQRLAVDEAGKVLVWTGAPAAAAPSSAAPTRGQANPPLAIPPHILLRRS